MTHAAAPIPVAWVSTGGTGARNYDEFLSYDEVTEIIKANPASILQVDLPQCTPQARALDQSFEEALPAAVGRLEEMKAAGLFRRETDVVVPYRIRTASGTAYGAFVMVSTGEISDTPDSPGRVIRNEDVFAAKVRERQRHVEVLRHLVSPVLLLASRNGIQIEQVLRGWLDDAGPPVVTDVDQLGQTHELWIMPHDAAREQLLELVDSDELVVADGNHRSLAAQLAGLRQFLAVVTTPDSLRIWPYNRLVHDLPTTPDEFLDGLRAAGCSVAESKDDPVAGTISLYVDGRRYAVQLPQAGTDILDRMDHAVVERVVFRDVLGLDPGDARITYVGGDRNEEWLIAEVDTGRADAALLIAPVSVADFVAVNLARLKMPRKSTWFMPKARAGLVVAELDRQPDVRDEP